VPLPPSVISGPPHGQNPPSPAGQLVRLNVAVFDKSRHRITNLPQSAFTVRENGAPQQIKSFKLEDAPVSFGLVIDNSGNMQEQRTKAEATALALIGRLNQQDEVFVVNFNEEPFLDLPPGVNFTSDFAVLKQALQRIGSRGGSAMRDAIASSIVHLKEHASHDKKILVVVAGGTDNYSAISMENLVRASQQLGVLSYPVGLLNREDPSGARRTKRELEELATATGGRPIFPKDLPDVYRSAVELVDDIRGQYMIAYTPANQNLDGAFRAISVTVQGPGSPAARTRQGYYATNDGL